MKITDIRRTTAQKRPVLKMKINGVEATFLGDAKRTLLSEGIVFVGPEFEGIVTVFLEANERSGRAATTLAGFSDDPELVGYVRDWIADLDAGRL